MEVSYRHLFFSISRTEAKSGCPKVSLCDLVIFR